VIILLKRAHFANVGKPNEPLKLNLFPLRILSEQVRYHRRRYLIVNTLKGRSKGEYVTIKQPSKTRRILHSLDPL